MEDRVQASLIALRRILRATEFNARALAKATGLTVPQLIVLEIVARNDRVAPKAIAAQAGVGQATATTLIAAHGDAPQLAYHFTKKTHASVVLDASPEATKEIVLKPSGDPEYNPCFG